MIQNFMPIGLKKIMPFGYKILCQLDKSQQNNAYILVNVNGYGIIAIKSDFDRETICTIE